jgi:hypothetical protein
LGYGEEEAASAAAVMLGVAFAFAMMIDMVFDFTSGVMNR